MSAEKNRVALAPTGIAPRSTERMRTRVVPRVPSKALLGEHGELVIEHAGREYRLRQTSTGKLILTA